MVCWTLLASVSLVFASGREGSVRGFWCGAVALGLVGALWSGTRLYQRGRLTGGIIAAVAVAVFAAMALGVLDGHGRGWTRMQVLVTVALVALVALVAVVGGLRLLVRQWTWGGWVAWAVPLVVTPAASSFIAAGSVLHALYADGLGLSPDDLDVPGIWQVAAAVQLLVLLSVVMAVPAWWGYARHRHHFYATPGDGFNVVLHVLLLLLMFGRAAGLALDSAQRAVDRTTDAAKRGEDPPAYFGVRPGWTCVEPVVSVSRLSGEGPGLQPARPYLLFGVVDGSAVLGDRTAGQPRCGPAPRSPPSAAGRLPRSFRSWPRPSGPRLGHR